MPNVGKGISVHSRGIILAIYQGVSTLEAALDSVEASDVCEVIVTDGAADQRHRGHSPGKTNLDCLLGGRDQPGYLSRQLSTF